MFDKLKKIFSGLLSKKNPIRKTDFSPVPVKVKTAPTRKNPLEKNCEICGKIFRVKSNGQRFCSKECREKFSAQKVPEKPCEYCGKIFKPKSNWQKYCSPACAIEGRRARQRANYEKKIALPKPTEMTCEVCGKTFQPKTRTQKYCSQTCYAAAAVIRAKKWRQEKPKAIQPERICEICGKTFQPNKHNQKFCSDCAIEGYKIKRQKARAKTTPPRHEIAEKTCEQCGKTFKPTRPYQKYCSKTCKVAHRNNPEKTCPICGKKFIPATRRANFCPECSHYIYSRDKICKNCGLSFKPDSMEQNFCSNSCKEEYSSRRMKKAQTNETDFSFMPKKSGKNKKTLPEWQKEAALCGMSYGMYRNAVEHLGKTFDELKLPAKPDSAEEEILFECKI